mgnify:CR=1 FL=1
MRLAAFLLYMLLAWHAGWALAAPSGAAHVAMD